MNWRAWLVCGCLPVALLWGQTPPPLELPEVIVVGKEERTIPGGAKQPPQPPAPLEKSLLDSLNPLSKHGLLGFFPLPKFPATLALPQPVERFVEGSIGQYMTATLAGFYRWRRKPGALTLTGYLSATQGHIRDADSLGVGAVVQARLAMPSGVWLWERSSGTVAGGVRWKKYQLFGDSGRPQRSVFAMGVQGELEARQGALTYGLRGTFRLFALRQGQNMQSEQHIRMQLHALYPDSTPPVGGITTQFDLRLWEERTQVVWEFLVPGIWSSPPWLFRGAAGIHVARLYGGESLFLPALDGEVQYRFAPHWRLALAGWSRLQEKGWQELWEANPYVDIGASPRPPYDRLALRAALQWVQGSWASIEAALSMRSVARWWNWERTGAGFMPRALSVIVWETSIDAFFQLGEMLTLGGTVQAGRAVATGGESVAYYAPLKLELSSEQRWVEGVRSSLGTEIVSSRSAARYGRLPGYARVWAELQYELMPRMLLKVVADNLLNTDIQLWNGYPERGIFVAAAVRWAW